MKKEAILILFFLVLFISPIVSAQCENPDMDRNYFIKETTTLYLPGVDQPISKTDYCISDKLLKEYYCDRDNRNIISEEDYECPLRCDTALRACVGECNPNLNGQDCMPEKSMCRKKSVGSCETKSGNVDYNFPFSEKSGDCTLTFREIGGKAGYEDSLFYICLENFGKQYRKDLETIREDMELRNVNVDPAICDETNYIKAHLAGFERLNLPFRIEGEKKMGPSALPEVIIEKTQDSCTLKGTCEERLDSACICNLVDIDGDGYYASSDGNLPDATCPQAWIDSYNSKPDCDDNNNQVYPKPAELASECSDGLDNDCDARYLPDGRLNPNRKLFGGRDCDDKADCQHKSCITNTNQPGICVDIDPAKDTTNPKDNTDGQGYDGECKPNIPPTITGNNLGIFYGWYYRGQANLINPPPGYGSNVKVSDTETDLNKLLCAIGKSLIEVDEPKQTCNSVQMPEIPEEELPKQLTNLLVAVKDDGTVFASGEQGGRKGPNPGLEKTTTTSNIIQATMCPEGAVNLGSLKVEAEIKGWVKRIFLDLFKLTVAKFSVMSNTINIYIGPEEDLCGLPLGEITIYLKLYVTGKQGMDNLEKAGDAAISEYLVIPGFTISDFSIPKPTSGGEANWEWGKDYKTDMMVRIIRGDKPLTAKVIISGSWEYYFDDGWGKGERNGLRKGNFNTRTYIISANEFRALLNNLAKDEGEGGFGKCSKEGEILVCPFDKEVYDTDWLKAWLEGELRTTIDPKRVKNLYEMCCPKFMESIKDAPEGEAEEEVGSTESFYMIRDENLRLSGVAYHFGPEGITFNNNVRIRVDESDFHTLKEDLSLVHVSDYMINNLCEIEVLEENSKTIANPANLLEVQNFRAEFPENSLSEQKELFVRRVILNCEKEIIVEEAEEKDSDNDSILDSSDNCQFKYNPNQEDFDYDGLGDICDFVNSNNLPKPKNIFSWTNINEESIKANLFFNESVYILVHYDEDNKELVYSNRLYLLNLSETSNNLIFSQLSFENPEKILDETKIKIITIDPSKINQLFQYYGEVKELETIKINLNENALEFSSENIYINAPENSFFSDQSLEITEFELSESNYYIGDWDNNKEISLRELINVIKEWIGGSVNTNDILRHIGKWMSN